MRFCYAGPVLTIQEIHSLEEDWLEPFDALQIQTNTFIVNIRPTPKMQGNGVEWRGQVEHVQTHERIYLKDLYELVDFIIAHSDAGTTRHQGLQRDFHKFRSTVKKWVRPHIARWRQIRYSAQTYRFVI